MRGCLLGQGWVKKEKGKETRKRGEVLRLGCDVEEKKKVVSRQFNLGQARRSHASAACVPGMQVPTDRKKH